MSKPFRIGERLRLEQPRVGRLAEGGDTAEVVHVGATTLEHDLTNVYQWVALLFPNGRKEFWLSADLEPWVAERRLATW